MGDVWEDNIEDEDDDPNIDDDAVPVGQNDRESGQQKRRRIALSLMQ
jgi:hypothetical protein